MNSSQRRLVSSLEDYVRNRDEGARSNKHVTPIVLFAKSELIARGLSEGAMRLETVLGHFFRKKIDLTVWDGADCTHAILVVTQSGSVRNNLTNRMRDIVGDAVNLRRAHASIRVGVIYLLRANEEALARGQGGTTPVEDLSTFFRAALTGGPAPLLDAAALIAADRDDAGRVRVEPVGAELDPVLFFDRLML